MSMNNVNYNYGYAQQPTQQANCSGGIWNGGNSNYGIQPRLFTNAIFVTSLEEALIKTDTRNSDMIYFDQDKNVFYRVKVDMEGKKSWAVFNYTVPEHDDNTPVTKADIRGLIERIEALEASKASPKVRKKENIENAESDG